METISIQNVNQITELGTLQPSGIAGIISLAFSHNSAILAIGRGIDEHGNGNNIELWRVSNRTLIGNLPFGHTPDDIAFHPDGNSIITVSQSPTFSIWDIKSQTLIRDVNIPIGHQPYKVAISPSGKTIVTGSWDGYIFFWDWEEKNPSLRTSFRAHDALPGGSAFIRSIEFSVDGLFLATGCSNGECRIWQMSFDSFNIPELRLEILTGTNFVNDLSFNGLGTMLSVASDDGNLFLIDIRIGQPSLKINPPSNQVVSCSFSKKEQVIVSTRTDLTGSSFLEFWNADTKTLLMAKSYLGDQVKFSPNGQSLVVIKYDPGYTNIPTIWGVPVQFKPIDSTIWGNWVNWIWSKIKWMFP